MLTPSKNITLTPFITSIARSQLGMSEVPKNSNWGPHVRKYLAAVGITFAAPWCMAFVYYVVNEACKELGIKNPMIKTGGCLRQWNEIDKKFKIVLTNGKWYRFDIATQKMLPTTILPGDIFIMDYGKGLGHTGFVSKVNGTRIETIEGNSNDEGSREGYEVCRKPGGRAISSIKGFIRLA